MRAVFQATMHIGKTRQLLATAAVLAVGFAPHKPRLVVTYNTCPPLSSSPSFTLTATRADIPATTNVSETTTHSLPCGP